MSAADDGREKDYTLLVLDRRGGRLFSVDVDAGEHTVSIAPALSRSEPYEGNEP